MTYWFGCRRVRDYEAEIEQLKVLGIRIGPTRTGAVCSYHVDPETQVILKEIGAIFP